MNWMKIVWAHACLYHTKQYMKLSSEKRTCFWYNLLYFVMGLWKSFIQHHLRLLLFLYFFFNFVIFSVFAIGGYSMFLVMKLWSPPFQSTQFNKPPSNMWKSKVTARSFIHVNLFCNGSVPEVIDMIDARFFWSRTKMGVPN